MNPSLQFLIFFLDGQRYAVPIGAVDRVVPAAVITPLPKAPEVVLGVLDVEGSILPVLSLRRRFGGVEREVGVHDHFLIAHTSRRTVVLVIDEARDLQEIAPAQITRASGVVAGLEHIQGVATLDDGLVLIHDLEAFLSIEETEVLEAAMQREALHGR